MSAKTKSKQKTGLQLEMKNFGPISRGKIDLKNLTIFIGPNNSGKSYAAMLLHSLFQAANVVVFSPQLKAKNLEREESAFRNIIDQLRSQEKVVLPADHEIYSVGESDFIGSYSKSTTKALQRNFMIESPSQLISEGSKRMEIKLQKNGSSVTFESNGEYFILANSNLPREEIEITIGKVSDSHETIESDGRVRIIFSDKRLWKYSDMLSRVLSHYIRRFHSDVFYLPPSRSGIMATRNLLLSSLVKDIDNSGKSEISGITRDFLSFFIDVQNVRQGKHRALAYSAEEDLINGEVLLEVNKLSSRSIINYQSGNLKIPIERTSSTIQELAPLLLYLKHSDPTSEYIFIEEPEAHLHPKNQRLLAHLLVKLIRAGLKILITTHSDYLLEQLGTFVMMSGLDEKERKRKYKYDKDDYLLPEEVSPYLFKYNQRARGYKIEPIAVSVEQGISTDEMSQVAESLYGEYAKLQNDLAEKKSAVD